MQLTTVNLELNAPKQTLDQQNMKLKWTYSKNDFNFTTLGSTLQGELADKARALLTTQGMFSK